jgi:hypothetical protein
VEKSPLTHQLLIEHMMREITLFQKFSLTLILYLSGLKHSCCLTLSRMLSKVGVATRAFVVVLLALAKRYKLLLTVNRHSSTEQLVKAYRKLLLKAHPDKGGRKVDFQKLQQAKETWDAVRKGPVNQGGRPSAGL